ncbi:hypothetical protein [Sorangium sp. So ce426]|uniref:hypothetical protein n=1 Tax=unclassified Sorangium TaxID=2621164 RepID=UPI003F5BF86C
MPRHLSAVEILRSVPAHNRHVLRELGVDLDDPADAKLFISGVRAAEASIAEQERWERERLG